MYVFLASDESRFITGGVFDVTGGKMLPKDRNTRFLKGEPGVCRSDYYYRLAVPLVIGLSVFAKSADASPVEEMSSAPVSFSKFFALPTQSPLSQ
jgi:hypothetical protein